MPSFHIAAYLKVIPSIRMQLFEPRRKVPREHSHSFFDLTNHRKLYLRHSMPVITHQQKNLKTRLRWSRSKNVTIKRKNKSRKFQLTVTLMLFNHSLLFYWNDLVYVFQETWRVYCPSAQRYSEDHECNVVEWKSFRNCISLVGSVSTLQEVWNRFWNKTCKSCF